MISRQTTPAVIRYTACGLDTRPATFDGRDAIAVHQPRSITHMTKEESILVHVLMQQIGISEKVLTDIASGSIHDDNIWSSLEDLVEAHSQFDDVLDRLCSLVCPF